MKARPRPAAVRPATLQDVDWLLTLEARVFPSDRLSRRSMLRLVMQQRVLVATHGANPVGYACVLLRRGSRLARLYSLAVMPEHGGRGVGATLLEAADQYATAAGCEQLRLEVRAADAPVIRFYERAGFTRFGQTAAFYEDGADALRMHKTLLAVRPGARPQRARSPRSQRVGPANATVANAAAPHPGGRLDA